MSRRPTPSRARTALVRAWVPALALVGCRGTAAETSIAPTSELPVASASAAIDAGPRPANVDAGAPIVIDAQTAAGPFPTLAALCTEIHEASPKTACKPVAAPSFVAEAPYLALAAVALSEDSWFTKIHPVIRTASGFYLAPYGEEAANVASTDMATVITVEIVDARVEDVVPGAARELVVHLAVRGTIALFDTSTKKFPPPSPSSASIGTIVCGLGPTDVLSCTQTISGEVAHDSAVPPPAPRLTIDEKGTIGALDPKAPPGEAKPAREIRFP